MDMFVDQFHAMQEHMCLEVLKPTKNRAESAMGRIVNSGKVWTPPENHIV